MKNGTLFNKYHLSRYGFTVLSNLLVYVITWYVLHIDSADDHLGRKIGPADAPKFQTVVWSGLSIGTVCTLIFHFFVKEEFGHTGNNIRAGQLRLSVGELLCNFQIYQVRKHCSQIRLGNYVLCD